MSTITNETATAIAFAYREIVVAEKLLADIGNEFKSGIAPDIRDAFGRPQTGLQLGVPSGGGLRVFHVQWSLAQPILEAHIAQQKSIISTLSEKARAEIAE